MERTRTLMIAPIAEHTGERVERVELDSLRDRWFSAEEARDYGLIVFVASRRRHTRLQGDWSSDVCSSDLALVFFSSRRRHTRLQGDWSSDVCFFFSSRRRHTRLQGDWSSDVCSSD